MALNDMLARAFAGWMRVGGVVRWALIIRDGTGWVTVYSDSSPVLDRWYCVELHSVEDSLNGLGEMWVDGVLACSISGRNTASFGSVTGVRFGIAEAYSCANTTIYADNLVILKEVIGQEP